MNDLTCTSVDEMILAYEAHALEDDERSAVAQHLAECRKHDEELQAVRADLNLLVSASVEPSVPPARLRSSLLDAFERERRVNAPAATPGPEREAGPEPRRLAASPPARMLPSAFGYALAAALLAIAVGLAAWGVSRTGNGETEVLVRSMSEGNASMQVTYVPSQQLAVLDLNLPEPPPGRTYQAWRIRDGVPTSIGVINQPTGKIALQFELKAADALALTVEPQGGSVTPTTQPVLSGSLQGS